MSNMKALSQPKRICPKRSCFLASAAAFILALFLKLWGMTLVSTFYYNGLKLNIYATKLTGDLSELNILNHYIGMMTINSSLPEFRWIPVGFGLIALLCLAMFFWPEQKFIVGGTIVSLLGLGAMGVDFYFRLYQAGHQLNSDAPIKVGVFTPKIMGQSQLANFHVTTGFGLGGLIAVLGAILLVAAIFSQGDAAVDVCKSKVGQGKNQVG
jgi:copper chaperone NosL